MSTVTINDRMTISQEVSREMMFDKEFVGKLVEESLVVFKNKCKRCPGRSNAKAGRKKKVASGRPLSDALEDEAQEREALQEEIDSEEEEETKVDNESPGYFFRALKPLGSSRRTGTHLPTDVQALAARQRRRRLY